MIAVALAALWGVSRWWGGLRFGPRFGIEFGMGCIGVKEFIPARPDQDASLFWKALDPPGLHWSLLCSCPLDGKLQQLHRPTVGPVPCGRRDGRSALANPLPPQLPAGRVPIVRLRPAGPHRTMPPSAAQIPQCPRELNRGLAGSSWYG